MDYSKTTEILKILSNKGYSLYDLAAAIEMAAKKGTLPQVVLDDKEPNET